MSNMQAAVCFHWRFGIWRQQAHQISVAWIAMTLLQMKVTWPSCSHKRCLRLVSISCWNLIWEDICITPHWLWGFNWDTSIWKKFDSDLVKEQLLKRRQRHLNSILFFLTLLSNYTALRIKFIFSTRNEKQTDEYTGTGWAPLLY